MSSQKLWNAAKNGNADEVTQILAAGGDVNYVNKAVHDYTPLIRAAEAGHGPIVQLLLEHGADANAQEDCGKTGLHKASYNGHPECVKLLLEHSGTEVNKQSKAEGAPLHMACSNGKQSCVRLLLEHLEIDINTKDYKGDTPLHAASRLMYTGVLQQLLESGARTDIPNKQGKLPIDMAPKDKPKAQEICDLLEAADKAGTGVKPKEAAAISQPLESDNTPPAKEKRLKLLGRSRKMTKAEHSEIIKRIHDDVSVLTSTLTNSISDLEKQIEELTAQINTKDATIAKKDSTLVKKDDIMEKMLLQMRDLQNLIQSLKSEVQVKSSELSKGVNQLIQKSNNYFENNCQENHLNDIVFLKIFESVCEKIRYQQDKWQKLGWALFVNFPEGFVTELLAEISSSYNTKKDYCLEMLFQWKLFSYCDSDGEKVEALLAALGKVLSSEDATELEKNVDTLLTQHQQKTKQEMKGSLTDKELGVLAGRIGKEWNNLGLFLEFSQPELNSLEKDFPAAGKRNLKMLLTWRNRETGFPDMKLGRLAKALGRSGRTDLAKALK